MEFLKNLWPIPFKIKKGNLASFIWKLIVFIVVTAIVGVLIKVLAGIPIVGIIFSILGSLVGVYNIIGIVLCVLVFIGVIS